MFRFIRFFTLVWVFMGQPVQASDGLDFKMSFLSHWEIKPLQKVDIELSVANTSDTQIDYILKLHHTETRIKYHLSHNGIKIPVMEPVHMPSLSDDRGERTLQPGQTDRTELFFAYDWIGGIFYFIEPGVYELYASMPYGEGHKLSVSTNTLKIKVLPPTEVEKVQIEELMDTHAYQYAHHPYFYEDNPKRAGQSTQKFIEFYNKYPDSIYSKDLPYLAAKYYLNRAFNDKTSLMDVLHADAFYKKYYDITIEYINKPDVNYRDKAEDVIPILHRLYIQKYGRLPDGIK